MFALKENKLKCAISFEYCLGYAFITEWQMKTENKGAWDVGPVRPYLTVKKTGRKDGKTEN